jgi:hypothetical protein
LAFVQSFWQRLQVGYKLVGTVALFSAVILSVFTITSTLFKAHRPAMELLKLVWLRGNGLDCRVHRINQWACACSLL